MKFKNIIIFSLLILVLSISAASAHENITTDVNDALNNDMISINHFDDDSDDLVDDLDDLDDDDSDDDDWEDYDDDSDDWDDDDSDDDDWDDDSDDWDDDDWEDDWDDDSDDWDDDDWEDYDDDWDVNYTNSSIKFYKLISYYRDGSFLAYKTTSSFENMTYADSCSEEDCGDICDDDSQEEFGLEDSQSFATSCPGDSSSFGVPDTLSENQGSVSKSINQCPNLLGDEKGNSVNVTDDKDNNTITFSSDNDLNVLGLLVSLLLSIILLI